LFPKKQILGGEAQVRLQGGPEELKDIDQHTDYCGDHGTMIPPERRHLRLEPANLRRMQYLRSTAALTCAVRFRRIRFKRRLA
jgi:hypothetical protein